MNVAVEACARGELLAVFPDLVGRAAGLRRVPLEDLLTTELYMMHRKSLAVRGRTEIVAAAIRAAAPSR